MIHTDRGRILSAAEFCQLQHFQATGKESLRLLLKTGRATSPGAPGPWNPSSASQVSILPNTWDRRGPPSPPLLAPAAPNPQTPSAKPPSSGASFTPHSSYLPLFDSPPQVSMLCPPGKGTVCHIRSDFFLLPEAAQSMRI